MAYEIFDDLAFYWFLGTLFSITLLPYTLWKVVYSPLKHKLTNSKGLRCKCSLCKKPKLKKEGSKTISLIIGFVLFILLWAFYIRILVFLYFSKEESFANFNPFEILGITEKATASEIKKKYYKLSLQLHPDKIKKDKDKSKLDKKYILIKKAYQSLTDKTTRENYEKFGHPDGHQGMSVTIGLPSFLSAKENELFVLSFYIVALAAIVVSVGYWWKKSVNYNSDGIYNDTIAVCCRNVTENSTPKQFIEILAISREFKVLERKPTKEVMELYNFAKKNCRLSTANYVSYINYSWTLLVCHFSKKDISKNLKSDYLFILKNVERIMHSQFPVLIKKDVWAQKLYNREKNSKDLMKKYNDLKIPIRPVLSHIALSQHICQKLWMDSDELTQIPHLTTTIAKTCRKNKINSVFQFLQSFSDVYSSNKKELKTEITVKNNEKTNLEKIILRGLKDRQIKDINCFLDALPVLNVEMKFKSSDSTEDLFYFEEEIVLKVIVNRIAHKSFFGEENTKSTSETISKSDKINESQSLKFRGKKSNNQRDINQNDINQNDNNKNDNNQNDNNQNGNNKNDNKNGIKKGIKKIGIKKGIKNDKKKTDKITNELEKIEKKTTKKGIKVSHGIRKAHCPKFPFEKNENWVVIVYDRTNRSVLHLLKTDLSTKDFKFTFRFSPDHIGKNEIEVLVISDCYVGLQFSESKVITVHRREGEKEELEKEPEEKVKIKELDEEEEDHLFDFKWYDILSLAIFVVLAYLILPKTEFWKKRIVPFFEWVMKFLGLERK